MLPIKKSVLLLIPIFMSLPSAGQQTASLRVTVVDTTGAAIPKAEVRVTGPTTLTGTAAQYGIVALGPLSTGKYDVTAGSRGFRSRTAPIVVKDGTNDVTIQLEVKPPSPDDIHILETFDTEIYLAQLQQAKEPGFCENPLPTDAHRYRLLWVPTFGHPILIRIDIKTDGKAELHIQSWSGQGGYEWGKPQITKMRELAPDEEADLFMTLADIGFWTLPATVENTNYIVLDGTEWIMEGVRDGKCHAIARYSSPLTSVFSQVILGDVAKLRPYYRQTR